MAEEITVVGVHTRGSDPVLLAVPRHAPGKVCRFPVRLPRVTVVATFAAPDPPPDIIDRLRDVARDTPGRTRLKAVGHCAVLQAFGPGAPDGVHQRVLGAVGGRAEVRCCTGASEAHHALFLAGCALAPFVTLTVSPAPEDGPGWWAVGDTPPRRALARGVPLRCLCHAAGSQAQTLFSLAEPEAGLTCREYAEDGAAAHPLVAVWDERHPASADTLVIRLDLLERADLFRGRCLDPATALPAFVQLCREGHVYPAELFAHLRASDHPRLPSFLSRRMIGAVLLSVFGVAARTPRKRRRVGGGQTLAAVPGIYSDVLELDVVSMYPSICAGMDPGRAAASDRPVATAVRAVCARLTRVRHERGCSPAGRRVLKTLANSMVGCLAQPAFWFYSPALFNRVTAVGRSVLVQMKTAALRCERVEGVVLGHTDSIFVHAPGADASLVSRAVLGAVRRRWPRLAITTDHFLSLLVLSNRSYCGRTRDGPVVRGVPFVDATVCAAVKGRLCALAGRLADLTAWTCDGIQAAQRSVAPVSGHADPFDTLVMAERGTRRPVFFSKGRAAPADCPARTAAVGVDWARYNAQLDERVLALISMAFGRGLAAPRSDSSGYGSGGEGEGEGEQRAAPAPEKPRKRPRSGDVMLARVHF